MSLEKTLGALDNARLELRRALEEHHGSNELDPIARFILEVVRAITAARRVATALHGRGGGGAGGDRRGDVGDHQDLEVQIKARQQEARPTKLMAVPTDISTGGDVSTGIKERGFQP